MRGDMPRSFPVPGNPLTSTDPAAPARHCLTDRHSMNIRFPETFVWLAKLENFRLPDAFEMELHDPVLGRRLRHRYEVEGLPVVA